jgi:succinate dehydrogenase / fumarate reductase, membrane anchor subunit
MEQRKSFRTPLGRVRWLGASGLGTDESMRMRVTAVALIPLTIAFVWIVLTLLSKDYNAVRAELGEPLPAILILLFIVAGVYHMEIGMRSVIVDYLQGAQREWALIANTLFAGALGLACVYAILRIGFV